MRNCQWIHAGAGERNGAAGLLSAACLEAKILAEKRQDMILETISHLAGMSTQIQFKAVRDPILIESSVELGGVDSETILIAYIN